MPVKMATFLVRAGAGRTGHWGHWVMSCSVEKIKEQIMRSFDDASLRRLFNWGGAAAPALPHYIMAEWLLKKDADGPKRLARSAKPHGLGERRHAVLLNFAHGI